MPFKFIDSFVCRSTSQAEIVETHDTELKLRVQDPNVKLWQIFSAIEDLRNKSGGTMSVSLSDVGPDGEGPPAPAAIPAASDGLIDDYSAGASVCTSYKPFTTDKKKTRIFFYNHRLSLEKFSANTCGDVNCVETRRAPAVRCRRQRWSRCLCASPRSKTKRRTRRGTTSTSTIHSLSFRFVSFNSRLNGGFATEVKYYNTRSFYGRLLVVKVRKA